MQHGHIHRRLTRQLITRAGFQLQADDPSLSLEFLRICYPRKYHLSKVSDKPIGLVQPRRGLQLCTYNGNPSRVQLAD